MKGNSDTTTTPSPQHRHIPHSDHEDSFHSAGPSTSFNYRQNLEEQPDADTKSRTFRFHTLLRIITSPLVTDEFNTFVSFSLGTVLYEMLNGQPPFRGENVSELHIHESPQPIDCLSSEMNDVLLKCLEKSPGDRYADVNELRQALLDVNLEGNLGK